MEQTKGYFSAKGKIWSLDNKEVRESPVTRTLSFGLQTAKENSIFLQLGEWKNTVLNVKMKGSEQTETVELNEQNAIDEIKNHFKDGDSVFVNARAEIDTYWKSLKYIINQIYIEKEPIDFESSDFEEYNTLKQSVIIIEKPENNLVTVGMTNYNSPTHKSEMIEQDLKLIDSDINDYFVENAKVGTLLKVDIQVHKTPNYIPQEEISERTTLKGKKVSSGRKIIDKDNPYTEYLEVVDVDIDKTEKKKYTREDIREAIELVTNKETNKNSESIKSEDDDLPF